VAKVPTLSLGYSYTVGVVDQARNLYVVSGPGICQDIYGKEEADTIAAALNFSRNFKAINRQMESLKDSMDFLKQFK